MQAEVAETAKVGLAGTGGSIATLALADVSTVVSISVGIVTFCYVGAKLYFLIRDNGKDPKE